MVVEAIQWTLYPSRLVWCFWASTKRSENRTRPLKGNIEGPVKRIGTGREGSQIVP
jgi:hypothetical protein